MKDTIILNDFLNDLQKHYVEFFEEGCFDSDTKLVHECSKCGRSHSEHDKFCSFDGKEIIAKEISYVSEEIKRDICNALNDFFEGNLPETPDSFPYTPVDSIEKRGDGFGYYMCFVMQRKSDGKYFYYCSYDGRIEGDDFEETTKKVITVWDFEKMFS